MSRDSLQWANHDHSLSLEEVTRKNIVTRVEKEVAKGRGTWIDWQYLMDAVALLRKVRLCTSHYDRGGNTQLFSMLISGHFLSVLHLIISDGQLQQIDI